MYSEPVRFLIASPCWAPKTALFPPWPRKKSPLRSGIWPPRIANSSGYARHGLGARLWPGSDQKADSGIHWTVFIVRGDDPAGVKVDGGASVKSFISFKVNLGS